MHVYAQRSLKFCFSPVWYHRNHPDKTVGNCQCHYCRERFHHFHHCTTNKATPEELAKRSSRSESAPFFRNLCTYKARAHCKKPSDSSEDTTQFSWRKPSNLRHKHALEKHSKYNMSASVLKIHTILVVG